MRIVKALVHAVAECNDCKWRSDDYLTAQQEARTHAVRNGHRVKIDLGYCGEYIPERSARNVEAKENRP